MTSKLDRLLSSIHPSRTFAEIDRRADEAMNTFSVESGQITDWPEYRKQLVRFRQHLDMHILGASQPVSGGQDWDWGYCVSTLQHAFGRNGEKAAFEMARTGNEGGLYAVLRRLSMVVVEEYSQREVSAKILAYWNELSVDEQWAACDEYLVKYGHLLPSELTEGAAARVRAGFWKVLEEHPLLVQRMERIGR